MIEMMSFVKLIIIIWVVARGRTRLACPPSGKRREYDQDMFIILIETIYIFLSKFFNRASAMNVKIII